MTTATAAIAYIAATGKLCGSFCSLKDLVLGGVSHTVAILYRGFIPPESVSQNRRTSNYLYSFQDIANHMPPMQATKLAVLVQLYCEDYYPKTMSGYAPNH